VPGKGLPGHLVSQDRRSGRSMAGDGGAAEGKTLVRVVGSGTAFAAVPGSRRHAPRTAISDAALRGLAR